MTQERASIFADDAEGDDFNVAGFAPKKPDAKEKTIPVEAVRAIADKAKFPSRESTPPTFTPAAPAAATTTPRETRRHRTGRNVQLNVKVRKEAMDAFYQIADAQGWVLGETLEHAVIALREKLSV